MLPRSVHWTLQLICYLYVLWTFDDNFHSNLKIFWYALDFWCWWSSQSRNKLITKTSIRKCREIEDEIRRQLTREKEIKKITMGPFDVFSSKEWKVKYQISEKITITIKCKLNTKHDTFRSWKQKSNDTYQYSYGHTLHTCRMNTLSYRESEGVGSERRHINKRQRRKNITKASSLVSGMYTHTPHIIESEYQIESIVN